MANDQQTTNDIVFDLDRTSPVPLYFQIEEALEREITSQRCPPGTRLPSEPVMCEQYDLSRSTVRQALARLEQRGLIVRRKGRGTFVQGVPPGEWRLQSRQGFFEEEVGQLGRSVTSRTLGSQLTPLPSWATEALLLPEGAEGGVLERLRSIDGDVALYVINCIPGFAAASALDESDPTESLYARLAAREGLYVGGGTRSLQAVAADEVYAELLEVRPGAPLIYIESVVWTADERRFDSYRAWLRTDRIRINVQV